MPHAWISYLVCGVLALCQLLPCPKEAIADPLLLLCNITKSLKESVLSLLIAIDMVCSDCCVMDNMVNMGTVNISNNGQH